MNTFLTRRKPFVIAVLWATASLCSWADAGHDHGEAPAATSGPAKPRFTATSEDFELVGVVNGKRITLYLDHAADNSPVKDATLELELGGTKVAVQPQGVGEFEALLAAELPPGTLSVTATVVAGQQSDLLAGDLDLGANAHASATTGVSWKRVAAWAVGGLLALAMVVSALRRLNAPRNNRLGGCSMRPRFLTVACCAVLSAALLQLAAPAWADAGHDHGDAPPAMSGDGPRRLPDGSVFLPKPAQRQIGVRTLEVTDGELPRSLELQGKVVMDPNAGGKVQALVAGRLEAGARGLPSLGQAVKKGDVLAYVVPSSGAIERSNQASALAELRAAKALADKRVARLQALADTVPRKDIEAAQSELSSLSERMAAVSGGLNNRDALVAPVSGVIASSSAVAGQVVDARELVFVIVDPTRLRIEALAYDVDVARDVAGATVAVGTDTVALRFIGAARSLREQALPMLFQAEGQALARLVVGQPVKVYVQTATRVEGIRIPAHALLRNPANQAVVWVKTAPERFEPRTVMVEPLDGASFAVVSGLKAGDRIAAQGASLINQIR